jgi:hypothetical protein
MKTLFDIFIQGYPLLRSFEGISAAFKRNLQEGIEGSRKVCPTYLERVCNNIIPKTFFASNLIFSFIYNHKPNFRTPGQPVLGEK